jgi:hypothetical protein
MTGHGRYEAPALKEVRTGAFLLGGLLTTKENPGVGPGE